MHSYSTMINQHLLLLGALPNFCYVVELSLAKDLYLLHAILILLFSIDRSSHSNPNLTDCIAVLFKNIFIYDLIGLPIIYLALKQRVTFTGPLPMW